MIMGKRMIMGVAQTQHEGIGSGYDHLTGVGMIIKRESVRSSGMTETGVGMII